MNWHLGDTHLVEWVFSWQMQTTRNLRRAIRKLRKMRPSCDCFEQGLQYICCLS